MIEFGIPLPDMALLSLAALAAGLVRGFVGFGTALIYLPFAGMVLEPIHALTTVVIFDLIGPLPVLRQSVADVHRKDLSRLMIGTLVALPVGLATLLVLPAEMFRFAVSTISIVMLAGLISGWRYHGTLGPAQVVGTGAAAGFLGGVAGIPGPPVIFVYMASPHPARVIRANTTYYLYGYDLLLLLLLLVQSLLSWPHVLIGLLLILPYLVGILSGAALFRPERERIFRWVAYGVIAGSALIGLPVWD